MYTIYYKYYTVVYIIVLYILYISRIAYTVYYILYMNLQNIAQVFTGKLAGCGRHIIECYNQVACLVARREVDLSASQPWRGHVDRQ